MRVHLAPRAGIWSRSVGGWDGFVAACTAGAEPAARLPEPVPDLLPAREGRRAPLYVRLGIEVAAQACRENGLSLAAPRTVFASSMGDIQITDYMCRALATPPALLSPTRFHNSVHNAASGYWSIGAGNRMASTAVAAHELTFPVSLLEAAALTMSGDTPVLLVWHDVPAPRPLDAVTGNLQPFAAAILLSAAPRAGWRALDIAVDAGAVAWQAPAAGWLDTLAGENDSARAVVLLEAMAAGAPLRLRLPLGAATSLALAAPAALTSSA